jgi:FkbM family methyltransferase
MKAITYSRYLYDYLKFGDVASVMASVRYLASGKSHTGDRVIHTSAGHFYCRKNTNDFQFANYYYEWGVKKYMLRHRKEFDVFIDAGACTGVYSIILSRYGMRCFAFEPVPETFSVLQKNIELNACSGRVQAFGYGLSDHNGTGTFAVDPVNTGASYLIGSDREGNCTAELHKLDSVYSSFGIRAGDTVLMKFDLEGSEPAALRGATEFIRNCEAVTLIIEDKHTGNESIRDILNSIAVFRYTPVDEFNICAVKMRNPD